MSGIYSVTQINTYIKNLFSRDYSLRDVTIRGEVSNCKYHAAGHIYFTLKDQTSAISCVMFQTYRQGLSFRLSDGMEIEASGQVSVYERSGSYQLYARSVRMSGQGELYERFLKLKADLEERGFFDPGYKKPIPPYPMKIGIVTSDTGAAIRDIVNVSTRRNPYVKLALMPALVQGERAAADLADAIRRMDRLGMDVMIVGRGGGSMEDLWPFNEEMVAEAIFDCVTPVISAVGHETDFTIADFVADLRAPTPSAAAELANFDYNAFTEQLSHYRSRMDTLLGYRLSMEKEKAGTLQARIRALHPKEQIRRMREKLSGSEKRLDYLMNGKADRSRMLLRAEAGRLDALSPLKKLTGGFGYVTVNSKAVTGIPDVRKNDTLTIRLSDGSIESKVTKVQSGGLFDEN